MALSSYRPCNEAGCGDLVRGASYCEKHQRKADQEKWRASDANRANAARRGYDGRWRKIRVQHLRTEPLCRRCKANGIVKQAEMVDHIIPLAHGGSHDSHNLQSLCNRCHAVKSGEDRRIYSHT